MSMKNSNHIIENRTRDLPACSTVLHLTAPPRAPSDLIGGQKKKNVMQPLSGPQRPPCHNYRSWDLRKFLHNCPCCNYNNNNAPRDLAKLRNKFAALSAQQGVPSMVDVVSPTFCRTCGSSTLGAVIRIDCSL
jgi:hypothetical protein